MADWKSCGGNFIEADIIRWREAIWKPKKSERSKPRKIGERLLTAEVVKKGPADWVQLRVTGCQTTNADDWPWTIPDIKTGIVMRRQRTTIGRGRAQRLLWSDETARRSVVDNRPRPLSRFLRSDTGR